MEKLIFELKKIIKAKKDRLSQIDKIFATAKETSDLLELERQMLFSDVVDLEYVLEKTKMRHVFILN